MKNTQYSQSAHYGSVMHEIGESFRNRHNVEIYDGMTDAQVGEMVAMGNTGNETRVTEVDQDDICLECEIPSFDTMSGHSELFTFFVPVEFQNFQDDRMSSWVIDWVNQARDEGLDMDEVWTSRLKLTPITE